MLKCDENSASAAYPPLFTMTMVSGSLRSAADHSAWIEYIDEPSPKSPMTFRCRRHGQRHADSGHAVSETAARA